MLLYTLNKLAALVHKASANWGYCSSEEMLLLLTLLVISSTLNSK